MNENNQNQETEKIEFNKRMIGKRVFCMLDGGFYTNIVGVEDGGHFIVEHNLKPRVISIFDIRSY